MVSVTGDTGLYFGRISVLSPPNSPINTYVAGEEVDIATFGGSDEINRARITGTFSYISGFAAYLAVCPTLLLSVITSKLNKVWLAILMGALALLMGNMLMTGSRGPVLSGVVVFVGFLIFNQLSQRQGVRKELVILSLSGVICFVASIYWFPEALDAFWQRATTSDSASDRYRHISRSIRDARRP